jgi:hypothetical protein
MTHISFGAHCTHSATAPNCHGLHPPPAKLHAADIWFCGVHLLCVMLTLYSPVPSAVQCQLPVGCDAGKRAGHARCHRQQAQFCLPRCRHSFMRTCPSWSSVNELCNATTNHIQNPAGTPGWRLACTWHVPSAAPVQRPKCQPSAHTTCMDMHVAVAAAGAPPYCTSYVNPTPQLASADSSSSAAWWMPAMWSCCCQQQRHTPITATLGQLPQRLVF